MQPNPQETADFVTFTEEILNGKLHFCAVQIIIIYKNMKFKVYLFIDISNLSDIYLSIYFSIYLFV